MAQDDTKGQSMSEEERRKKNKGGDKNIWDVHQYILQKAGQRL